MNEFLSLLSFQDVDECGEGRCAQQCVNTPGGFTCSCNPGYTLNNDGTTCDGNFILLLYCYNFIYPSKRFRSELILSEHYGTRNFIKDNKSVTQFATDTEIRQLTAARNA